MALAFWPQYWQVPRDVRFRSHRWWMPANRLSEVAAALPVLTCFLLLSAGAGERGAPAEPADHKQQRTGVNQNACLSQQELCAVLPAAKELTLCWHVITVPIGPGVHLSLVLVVAEVNESAKLFELYH